MGMLSGIGIDFIRLVFGVLLFLLTLRLLLQLFRTDFYNPLSQQIVRATAFLDPLRHALKAWHGLDLATLLAIVALKLAEIAVVSQVALGQLPGPAMMIAATGVSLVDQLAGFFFFAIIAVVILSWVAPDGRNPATQLLWGLTEPVLGPARRLLPPMGGLDLSPIIVMFLIHVVRAYLVPLLANVAGVPLGFV